MPIIAHPLTQLNGSPQYTASDYRKSVNALILPSDGTTFGTVQGVRAGSPSPLMSVNSTTVTVKAHAGILCPWAGVGAYTYQMDADASVSIADTTGTYKIALVLSDPSQSHGTTPGLALQSFPVATPDSSIAGLVLGQVVAGVASDLAPRILQQTLISVATLSVLQAIPGVDGQRARVTSDGTPSNNAEYRRVNGVWLPLMHHESGIWSKGGGWASGSGTNTDITFARPFSVVPLVSVNYANVRINAAASNITTTGCRITAINNSGSTINEVTPIQWDAMELN